VLGIFGVNFFFWVGSDLVVKIDWSLAGRAPSPCLLIFLDTENLDSCCDIAVYESKLLGSRVPMVHKYETCII